MTAKDSFDEKKGNPPRDVAETSLLFRELFVKQSIDANSLSVRIAPEYVLGRDILYFLNNVDEHMGIVTEALAECASLSLEQVQGVYNDYDYFGAHLDALMAYDPEASFVKTLESDYISCRVDDTVKAFHEKVETFQKTLLDKLSDDEKIAFLKNREDTPEDQRAGVIAYQKEYGSSYYEYLASLPKDDGRYFGIRRTPS